MFHAFAQDGRVVSIYLNDTIAKATKGLASVVWINHKLHMIANELASR